MTVAVNKIVAGTGDEFHRVLLSHVSTTVTIDEDLGGVLTSATHSAAGTMLLVWNKTVTGSNQAPGISGFNCPSNVVAQVSVPDEDGCTIITRLVNTGGVFNSARTEFFVKRSA